MSYEDSYERRRRSPPRYDDRRGPPPTRDYDRGGSGGYNGPPKRPYQAPMYDRPPPPKRVRDWGEDTYDPVMPKRQSEPEEPKAKMAGPILMSFKQFLATQDDSITDEDAIKKYNDYKLEYKRQQLHQFFIEHKDEEWFAIKYHPELSKTVNEQYVANVRRRLEVFQWLRDQGYVARARLDADNTTNILKLLDALVVKLEDGTDEDVLELVEEYDEDDKHLERKAMMKKKEEEAKKFGAKDAEELLKDDDDLDGRANGEEKVTNGKSTPTKTGVDETSQDSVESGEVQVKPEDKPPKVDDDEIEEPRIVNIDRKSKTKNLHKTSSIFLRNVAPSIKKAEIEELCKRFPGYLRVGLADPAPERDYARRGWISFRRDVNIKEICWNLSSIRIRDCDFGAIVNRDLARRVRVVNGVTAHKTVAQNDLRLAARLCQLFDARAQVWQDDDGSSAAAAARRKMKFDLPEGVAVEMRIRSANPLLENIEDMLIEEASAEEDELLGRNAQPDAKRQAVFERDDVIIKALDHILVYLRLVHSIDFYNHTDYPHEDEMPNRCGLIHVRGSPPSVKEFSADDAGHLMLPNQFLTDFSNGQQSKMLALLEVDAKLSDEEVVKLGKKSPDREVEAFITANCVELSKDKWTCPLSGKKFKGPEFVRKHILGKHSDKLEEVAAEVTYFNNYLLDAHRPQPPAPDENALHRPPPSLMMGGGGMGGPGQDRARGYNQPQWDRNGPQSYRGGSYNRGGPPSGMGGGGYRGGGRGGDSMGGGYRGRDSGGGSRPPSFGSNSSRGGPPPGAQWMEPPARTSTGRELISYKDLDAPDEVI